MGKPFPVMAGQNGMVFFHGFSLKKQYSWAQTTKKRWLTGLTQRTMAYIHIYTYVLPPGYLM